MRSMVIQHQKSEGTVKWFDNDKGFGFAVNRDGEDVFVHHRGILGEGYKTLTEGDAISFVQVRTDKGWQAHEVELSSQVEPV